MSVRSLRATELYRGQIKRWNGSAWVMVGVVTGLLADAAATKTVSNGNLLILPPATLTTNRTLRLGASGATTSESITVERYDLGAFTYTIVDDASSATLYTFPVSVSRAAVFSFDGTNYSLVNHVAINPQVNA